MSDKRIIEYGTATELADDDYLVLDSESGGTCKILAKKLEPPKPTRITATYTQSGTVYDTDELDILIPDLVVTAYYEDGTVEHNVSGYILSGELTVGESTITCTYRGKSATFTVTVSSYINYLYKWDFTQSLTDSVQGVTATLVNCTQSNAGVTLGQNSQIKVLDNWHQINLTDKTVELDIGEMSKQGSIALAKLLDTNNQSYFFSYSDYWKARLNNTDQTASYYTSQTDFNNITMKFIFTSGHLTVTTIDTTNNESQFYDGGTFAINGNNFLNIGGVSYGGYPHLIIKAVRIYANQ